MKKILIIFSVLITIQIVFSQTYSQYYDAKEKVKQINEEIKKMGAHWKAGITPYTLYQKNEMLKTLGIINGDSSNEETVITQEAKNEMHSRLLQNGTNYVSLHQYMSPIEDQGDKPICWAHASTGIAESMLHIKWKWGDDKRWQGRKDKKIDIDENFLAGQTEGYNGAQISDGLGHLINHRVRSEQGINNFPNYDQAYWKISEYSDIGNFPSNIQLMNLIDNETPVAVTMDVYSDFYNYLTGIYEPTPEAEYIGPHGVVLVGYGYKEVDGLFINYWICKNSFGQNFGDSCDIGEDGILDSGYFKIKWGVCSFADNAYTCEVTWNYSSNKCYAKEVPEFCNFTDAFNSPISTNEKVYIVVDEYPNDGYSSDVYNNVNISSPVMVNNDVNFGINLGVTLDFENNTNILVNGTLDAQGTSSEPIVFTSSGTWDGIKLVNAGSSTLEYCEIKNADNGIYLSNSDPTIKYCRIHNNSNDGVVATNGSDVSFQYTTIEDNGGHGTYNFNNSYGFIAFEISDIGRNEIINNNYSGIYNADGFIGLGPYGGGTSFYNSIYGNNNYAVYNDIGQVDAQKCWWGAHPPNYQIFGGPGFQQIDYDSALTYKPSGGSSLSKTIASSNDFNPDLVDTNTPEGLWQLVNYYFYKNRSDRLINTAKKIIAIYPDSKYAKPSLGRLFQISEKTKSFSLIDYINELQNKEMSLNLEKAIKNILILSNIREGQLKAAKSICENTINKFPNTESEMVALYNLITIASNKKEADGYLDLMKKKYPDNPLTLHARSLMGEDVDWAKTKEYQPKSTNDDSPELFELSSVSPNPFNPTTNIRFALPEAARVDISVYNLLGKRVWSHQSNNFKAGYHSIAWHGVDNTGSKVSSGIYIIRIRSKNQQATQKVMLMK